MSRYSLPVPALVDADHSWVALADQAVGDLLRVTRPLHDVGALGVGEVLDHHCLPLIAEPTAIAAWNALSAFGYRPEAAPELHVILCACRARVLDWAADLAAQLQDRGAATMAVDADTIAATALLDLGQLAVDVEARPVEALATYRAVRAGLSNRFAPPMPARS